MTTTDMPWQAGRADAPPPPLRPGLPLLGSTLALAGDILPFMLEGYRRYGPIFRARIPGRDYFFLVGPDANRLLGRTADELLIAAETYSGMAAAMQTSSFILAHDGPRHRALRKLLKPGYSRHVALAGLGDLARLTAEACAGWRPGQVIRVVPFFKRLITRQLGLALLRRAPDEYVDDLQLFQTATAEVTLVGRLPRWYLRLPHVQRAYRRVMELTDEVIAEHRRAGAGEQRDILDDVLAAYDAPGSTLSEDIFRAVTIGTFIAGIDTVALTCCFLLYALLKHPGVIEQIRPELERFDPAAADPQAELRRMEWLHAAMLEGLRLYPVGPGAPRTAAQPFSFAGYQVPQGAHVIVGTGVTHLLPEFFPDPQRFDPGRYIAPRAEHRQPGVFAPFTLGEHTCLGAGFAEIQVMATLAALLKQVRLELHPADYRLRVKTAPSRGPRNDLAVRVLGPA